MLFGLISLFVLCLILLSINSMMAKKFENIAFQKGYAKKETYLFAMCFLLGFIGYLYVLALPDLTLQKQNEKIISLLEQNKNEET